MTINKTDPTWTWMTLFWIPPWAFVNFWLYGRFVAYFLWSEDQATADFEATLGTSPEVTAGFRAAAIHPMVDPEDRLLTTRIHVGVGVIWGLIACFQLLWFVRRFMALHRYLGYVFYIATAIQWLFLTYILFIKGMVPMGTAILVEDIISWVIVTVCAPLGFWYIRRKEVTKHRAMMLLLASAIFSNPLQRFLWVLCMKLLTPPPTTFKEFIEGPTAVSAWVATVIVHGVAAYYAYFTKPLAQDLKYERKVLFAKKN